ncbi:unnamed protein product [Closterium sp. Yama58-4]|nr:unnamed protein product [Closterium sp. Yama58-4]
MPSRRCIFTLDLKFPPTLVNFIIQQCGGIVYQWFTEELARIYDDPSSTKGKAFRQALHDEPLYNHVRAVMEKYRAARAAEQQQLEAEQQRKHQELVGGQQNGQAVGERILLDSKEEDKSFRDLGAEVEAKIESLVASVSRRASSNGSIDGDGVEIVEAGAWGGAEARPGVKGMGVEEASGKSGLHMEDSSNEGGFVTEGGAGDVTGGAAGGAGDVGGGAAGGAGGGAGGAGKVGAEAGVGISRAAVTSLLHRGPVPDSPQLNGIVQKVTVEKGATGLHTKHPQNGRYGLRASESPGTGNNGYTLSASDHRLFQAVDTLDRAIAALRLLHPASVPATPAAAAAAVGAGGGAAGGMYSPESRGRGATAAAGTAAGSRAKGAVAGERRGSSAAELVLSDGFAAEQHARSSEAGGKGRADGGVNTPNGDGDRLPQKHQKLAQRESHKSGWGRLRKALTMLQKTG